MIHNKLKHLITSISPELSIRLQYLYYFRKRIRLDNPQTLDEKIQWMKLNLYGKDPIFTQCADKYRVREYIKSCDCEELLNELIAVHESPSQIDWNALPNKFVIKWNFGNGYNIICHDKKTLDIDKTIDQLESWGKENAWLTNGEIQYKDIPKRIIIEKFIETGTERVPDDYKIYCFHGKPLYMFVCVGREKGTPKFYFFDKEWKLARINPDSINAPADFTLTKPPHLEEMFHYAAVLSQRFPFVRVDFYDTPQKVYFGELTFTPSGGFDTHRLQETQQLFGDLLDLTTIPNL